MTDQTDEMGTSLPNPSRCGELEGGLISPAVVPSGILAGAVVSLHDVCTEAGGEDDEAGAQAPSTDSHTTSNDDGRGEHLAEPDGDATSSVGPRDYYEAQRDATGKLEGEPNAQLRACGVIDDLQLGSYKGRPQDRGRRIAERQAGRREQRERMSHYRAATVTAPQPRLEREHVVAFGNDVRDLTRTARLHSRSSIFVGHAEASAFCVDHPVAEVTDEKSPMLACGSCDAADEQPAPKLSSRRRLRVLVLFAGRKRPESLANVLQGHGHLAVTFERMDSPEQDLSVDAVQRELLSRVYGGEFDAIFLAPPCASFSIALDVALRSRLEPEGLSTLVGNSLTYVQSQNALVDFTVRICIAAEAVGTIWAIENPASRREWPCRWDKYIDRGFLWDMPSVAKLRKSANAEAVTLAQCQFGAPWQKYSSLLVCQAGVIAARRIFGNARCSCSHHDVVLRGVDPESDVLRTAQAAAYPPQLCAALSEWIEVVCEGVRPVDCLQATGLYMGSEDPHGLSLDDDRAPNSKKATPFNVAGHLGEAGPDLATSPLPVFNAAPSTEPLDPPSPPDTSRLPEVRGLADLLRGSWLRKLRRWRRDLRRCLTLASRGDWRASKQARPKDFWVPASAMLTAVAEVDWDLRPWAEGLPAIPIAPSGRRGVRAASQLNVQLLEAELLAKDFADLGIVSEAIDGITDDVVAERGSFLCAPHTGALKFYSEADARLRAGVSEGWAREYDELPFWPLRCDPYSLVDESARAGKPKFRLTNDHSWPPVAPGAAASLNGSMDRSAWPAGKLMRVKEMARAAAILETSQAPVKLSVIDVVAYYKQLARQRAEWHRNGAFTVNGVLIDERCCFGSAADACKCSRFSNFIVYRAKKALAAIDTTYPPRDERVLRWQESRRLAAASCGADDAEIADRWTALHAVGMYIDDESLASIDDDITDVDGSPLLRGGVQVTRATLHYEAILASMRELGLEPTKEQSPRRVVDLLGATIDLDAGRMRLSLRKRESYAIQARATAAAASCTHDELQSLLGKLNFAADFYPIGRQWLHAAWRALRARFRTSPGTRILSKSARIGLKRWADELSKPGHEGVPLAPKAKFPAAGEAGSAVIYADASRDSTDLCGYCAWTVKGDEFLFIEGRWSKAERERLLICDLELAASTFGLVTFAPLVGGEIVYSFTDNEVAKSAMRSQTPSTLPMQTMTVARTAWLFERGIAEKAERVTSKANLWADLGSRSAMGELLRQAARVGLRPRRLATPPYWRALVAETAASAREEA